MSHTRQEKIEALGRVIDTLDILRVKCPWDRKQTNESLRENTIEEVYELCDALIKSDDVNIRKEFGAEQLKLRERGGNRTVLAGVPKSLPAVIKAYRIQEKAANVGFDWENREQVWDKAREEFEEFGKPALHPFHYIEAKAAEAGRSLKDMTLGEMDELWNDAKKEV